MWKAWACNYIQKVILSKAKNLNKPCNLHLFFVFIPACRQAGVVKFIFVAAKRKLC
jgi:hypothetical protein